MEPSAALRDLVAAQSLDQPQARQLFDHILSGDVDPSLVAGILTALAAKGVTASELLGALAAIEAVSIPLELKVDAPVIDTCGTGGDHSSSINVSTLVAFVAAGAGVKVCKHGNRAASSLSGSADILEDFGAIVDLEADDVRKCIDEVGIGFCFAPRFHPALREMAPIRRALGIPTIFNMLGPLANPARVTRQLHGISNPATGPMVAEVLADRGANHAMVVHGNGLDEITLSGPTHVWDVRDGKVTEFDIDPKSLGFEPSDNSALKGGDASHNAQIARRVFGGEDGAYRDCVVINSAAALVVGGRVGNLEEGVALAAKVIDEGEALQRLESFVACTQKLAKSN